MDEITEYEKRIQALCEVIAVHLGEWQERGLIGAWSVRPADPDGCGDIDVSYVLPPEGETIVVTINSTDVEKDAPNLLGEAIARQQKEKP